MALFVAGCASNKPFRTSFAPYNPTDPNHIKAVEEMIRTEAGIGQTNNAQGIVILLFVHGWKNNAVYDNDNVEMFRKTLKQPGTAEMIQTNHVTRKVVGVYAGWRGLSAEWEPFKELSFWERKNTAHKVGGYGAMTELLVDLETSQQAGNDSLATKDPEKLLTF